MEKTIISTKRINVDRVTVTSRKSLQDVLSKFDAAVGHPNIEEFSKRVTAAKTNAEMEKTVQSALGPSGFIEFTRFDQGGVVYKGEGGDKPKGFTTRHRQSADHARNGEACAGRRILRAGHHLDS